MTQASNFATESAGIQEDRKLQKDIRSRSEAGGRRKCCCLSAAGKLRESHVYLRMGGHEDGAQDRRRMRENICRM